MPSKSKQQQKFMGMVHSLQKGDMKPSDASPEVKKAAKSMGKKDAKDYASTSHKGLPKRVKQEIARKLKEYATKMGKDHMGGDSIPSQNKGGLRDNDGYDNVDYNRDMPMDEGFKPEYKGNDDIIWKKGKTQKGVTNYIPYYKGHNIDNGGHNFKTEKELLSFIKDYIVSNQIYSKYRNESIKENFPSNWLQGRVSDYHTKKGTTPRDDYDDTNFNTKHSGQEDLEDEESVNEENPCWTGYKQVGMKTKGGKQVPNCVKESVNESSDTLVMLQLLNKAMSTMPNSPKQKEIIKKLNVLRVKNKMKPLKEAGYSLSDLIGQVKTFDKPKDEKLLTIKVINKLKDKRNKTKSSSTKQKLQKMIDTIESDYKKGKYLKEYGAISQGYHLEPSQEDKLKGTPEDKMAIDEVGIFPIQSFIKDLIPGNIIRTVTPQDKERLKSTLKDLIFTLNKFWKQHNIPYRVRESVIDESVDKDDLKNAKFRLKKVLKYLDIEYKKNRRGEKYVQINYIPVTTPQYFGPEFVNVRYEDENDLQNIGKALKLKLKESVSEVAKRDYKAEYKKFQSSTKAKKYRAELNKYNRQKGTYGNGDGKDASHKGGKIVGFETESKNRGRREKSRLKKK